MIGSSKKGKCTSVTYFTYLLTGLPAHLLLCYMTPDDVVGHFMSGSQWPTLMHIAKICLQSFCLCFRAFIFMAPIYYSVSEEEKPRCQGVPAHECSWKAFSPSREPLGPPLTFTTHTESPGYQTESPATQSLTPVPHRSSAPRACQLKVPASIVAVGDFGCD